MELSLVIPVFNAENYIDECIGSIIKEIEKDKVEVIIIDDGSTDNSLDICNRYSDENVKIFSNSNQGVSYSRNYGIDKSKGKWIMFVDSDDKLIEGWYSIVKRYFQSKEDIVIFSSNTKEEYKSIKDNVIENIVGIKKNNLYMSSPCSKLYSCKLLKDNKINFDENIINGEDMLFNIKCFLKTTCFDVSLNGIYKYRIHIDSSTKRFDKNFIKSDLAFHAKLTNLLSEDETISRERKDNIILFCKKNSLIVIAQRLCFSGKYNTLKKNEEFFIKYFEKHNNEINIGAKKEIIIFLLKYKLYLIVFLIFNLMRKKIKNDSMYFINI